MKCEYCENEIPESTANFCPFCGAKIECGTKVEMPPAAPVATSWLQSMQCGDVRVQCGENVNVKSDLPSPVQRNGKSSDMDDGQTSKIRSFIRHSRQQGWFKSVDVSEYGFVPNSGETVYEVVSDVMLNETRSIRRSHTAKTGSSSYDYEGQSESKTYYEFQEVTRGRLFLTSKRIVFTGGQQVRNIPFADIVSFESNWQANGGALQISSSKRTKAMRFTRAAIFLFTVLYQALRNEKFRTLLESGPEDELVAKFKEVGLFKPMPKPQPPRPKPVYRPKPIQATPQNDDWKGCGCLVAFIIIIVIITIINS